MKKALCFLLVILMMCPFHILAAEVDWLAPITLPGEAPVEPQAEPPGEFLDVLQPETPVESPATSPEEAPSLTRPLRTIPNRHSPIPNRLTGKKKIPPCR